MCARGCAREPGYVRTQEGVCTRCERARGDVCRICARARKCVHVREGRCARKRVCAPAVSLCASSREPACCTPMSGVNA